MMCNHDREIEWQPKEPRQRCPRFVVYCTKCGAESRKYRLPGHSIDDAGCPVDLYQACDDVLDSSHEILP